MPTWMKARCGSAPPTPYTISFEEASRLSPQIREILLSFPQVTTVANELGRPDDGTDPTGFFNNEILCRPAAVFRQVLERRAEDQAATDRGRAEEAGRFPRRDFNYTQPPKTPWTRPKPVSRARWR